MVEMTRKRLVEMTRKRLVEMTPFSLSFKRPSEERMRQIKQAMHTMGEELVAAVS